MERFSRFIPWRVNHDATAGRSSRSLADSSSDLQPFLSSEDDTEKAVDTRSTKETHTAYSSPLPLVLPWVLSLVFMITSITLYVRQGPAAIQALSKFPLAHHTDFKPAHGDIDLEVVTFTGSPVFHENGTFYVPRPGRKAYIGTPSPEIDKAWDELTWGRYFRITEEEAIEALGDARDAYWNDKVGGYMAGIDMFHALHCLDRLRKSLWPDYYPKQPQRNHFIHREHCIDHIRQMLMCSGDMTLIPTVWSDHIQRNYVESDVPHTCRNFGKLREWVSSRHNGSSQVPYSPEKKHEGSKKSPGLVD